MRWILVSSFVFLSGCASFWGSSKEQSRWEDPAVKAAEQAQISSAQKVLDGGNFEGARKQFQEFQEKNRQSIFIQAARLGEAQALAGLGKYQEAVDIYRDVYLKTLKAQPEIAAQALYSISFSYEALGDDLKAMAALLDAHKMGEFLPIEIEKAEIPARLAGMYGRLERDQDAIAYLNKTEIGIEKVMAEKGPKVKNDWLAKTYVQMGSVSTNQLSSDNFNAFIQGQKWVQVYLIKALRVNDPTWSLRAQEKLQTTYRDLYKLLETVPDRAVQNDLGGSLLELLDQAELYRPMSDQKMTSYEESFYTYLVEVRKKTERVVFGGGETMGLTSESQKLNSLKRSGRIKVDSLLPDEEKSSISVPPKVFTSEDPNL